MFDLPCHFEKQIFTQRPPKPGPKIFFLRIFSFSLFYRARFLTFRPPPQATLLAPEKTLPGSPCPLFLEEVFSFNLLLRFPPGKSLRGAAPLPPQSRLADGRIGTEPLPFSLSVGSRVSFLTQSFAPISRPFTQRIPAKRRVQNFSQRFFFFSFFLAASCFSFPAVLAEPAAPLLYPREKKI